MLTGVTSALELTISAGKTVVWKAELTGSAAIMVEISGCGTLDVATGGLIRTSGSKTTIDVGENTTVKVSEGKVENTHAAGSAIVLDKTGAKAEVTSGEVTGGSYGIGCTSTCLVSAVSVTGGTVRASETHSIAIYLENKATATISGNVIVTGGLFDFHRE